MNILRSTKDSPSKESTDEVSYKQNEGSYWKKIFNLPSEPVWYAMITLMNYVNVLYHLYTCVNGICATPTLQMYTEIFIVLDGLYLVDIVLSIIEKFIPNMKRPEVNPSERPLYILILEILSLFPLEKFTDSKRNVDLYCLLRINRALRAIKIFYLSLRIFNFIYTKLFVHIVYMFAAIVFVVMINFTVYCSCECLNNKCTYHPCSKLYVITIIMTKLINIGNDFFDVDIAWELTTTINSVFIFIFILTIGQATMTLYFINDSAHKVAYEQRYYIIRLRHKIFKSALYLQRSSEEVFKLLWKNCQGYDDSTDYLNILTPALHNEILIDVSWPAFQHSKIFRNMDLPYLRYISKFMTQQFRLPGEFLIRKNEWKNKMIYVASGVIQLLSEEDGESPIMSLTSGTCIGESSLIVNYKSINSVRCQTFCEIHVLEKKDILKTFQRFPKRYKMLKNVIAQRYFYAKTTSALANAVKMNLDQSERQTDIYTIFWIKNTLHRLMSRDAESTYRHEFQNIYLLNEVSIEKINKLLFTAVYLDLLVITERIQSDVDTIFVRTRFPCLLQPLSILVVLWEILVVCISIFLSFTIPVFAFVMKETSPWYLPMLYIGTFIYWCDLYVQLSTSLKTRQGVYTKFKQIAIARMQSMGFWVDMLSSMPLEVFTCVVLSTNTPQNRVRMHLNRTLKLWRVARLFKLWEEQFNVNIVIIRLVKFTCLMVYLSFVMLCALYNLQTSADMHILFFIATQIVTGVGMTASSYDANNFVFMVAYVTCTFCGLLFYASIASGCVLNNLNLLRIQQVSNDLLTKLRGKKLYRKYNGRIVDYLSTQWEDNRCYHFQSKLFSVIYISKLIYNETVDAVVGETVRSLAFFKLFNNDFILDLCGKLLLMSFPPNEIIIRAGDISTEIIITHVGCFEMIAVGEKTKVINVPMDINLLEILLGVPNHNTCISKTYCRVFKLDYKDFIQILVKYPSQLDKLNNIIKSCADLKEKLLEASQQRRDEAITSFERKRKQKSFYHFGYSLKVNSFEEYDYFIPFDRLFPFAWIRFLLLRTTILPNRWFLLFWEISRSILAIMSALAYFTVPIAVSKSYIILYVLDTTALVDLYVRLHVCYFDENGLLIKHPLKTSMHYLSNGFLIDLISVLPLRHFGSINNPISYYLLNSNRLLQMHRYIHFMYYLQTNMIKPTSKYFILSYIPIILVLANICGSCLVFQECTFDAEKSPYKKSKDLDGLLCHSDSILLMSNIQKPITKWRAHLYGLYIATSVLTTAGFQGFTMKLKYAFLILISLSIFGFYLIIVICGYIHTFYTFRQAYLLETQFQIRHLKKYLELLNVSYELRTNVIKTYELKWKKMKGQSIHMLTKPFSAALRGDVLYDYFGKDVYVVSPFKTKTSFFYRNLLLHMNHDIILKGGYLSTINDVEKRTYILLKGTADILLPDGTKMTAIYPGSMYGNLESVSYVRICISIVAMSHVEVLSIDSLKFQSILNFHYKIKEEFCELRKVYLTHIPSSPDERTFAHLLDPKNNETYSTYFLRAFDPNGRAMLVWKYLTLIYSCYIGILLDFYQIGVFEYSSPIVAMQFTCDALFLMYFILKDRLAYEDESGNIITNIKMIQVHNRKDTLKLWIAIVSLVPGDVVVFLMPFEKHTRNYYYGIFRLNRLLRLFYVFDYFATKKKKLNVNVLLIRIQYVVFWTSLIIIILSSLFALASCTFPVNLHPRVSSCALIQDMPSMERFRLFTMFLYVVADCFTLTSQHNYYPQSSLHIVIFIVLLLIGQALYITSICEVFSILYDINIKKSKFRSTIERITYFLHTENVSASLLQRVTAYVQQIWSHQEGEIYSDLLDAAPLYLQDAVLNNAFNHIISPHPIFNQCHPDLLRQIIQKLRTRTYFVGDFIQFRGSIDESMYFVLKGEVGVLYDEYRHKDDYLRKLTNGDSFSVLQGVYHRKAHTYSYRSMKRTSILRLDLNDWEYLLPFFPASRESIFAVAKTYTEF